MLSLTVHSGDSDILAEACKLCLRRCDLPAGCERPPCLGRTWVSVGKGLFVSLLCSHCDCGCVQYVCDMSHMCAECVHLPSKATVGVRLECLAIGASPADGVSVYSPNLCVLHGSGYRVGTVH